MRILEELNVERYLLYIFLLSGMTGLIYQVAWQRLLTLYYGVGSISTTITISVFMFGLGLGALVGGRYIDKIKNKLLVYFIIELLIGVFGLLSVNILELIGLATAGIGYHFVLLYVFLFLSIPTFLMGTTLPILCSLFSRINPNFLHNISFLYFINTLGAAIGAIFSAYILISFFGIDIAIYFAAFLNILLAVGIFIILQNYSILQQQTEKENLLNNEGGIALHLSYLIIFITGFLALGYEIIWFRLLMIITKSSPYSFASVLFVYLLGIAMGSYLMQKVIAKHKEIHNKSTFFIFQFLIAIYVIFSIFLFFYGTKYTSFGKLTLTSFKINPHPLFSLDLLGNGSSKIMDIFMIFWQNLDVFIWSMFFLFIPTLLMGASFPLISSLSRNRLNKTGSTVGSLYFFNIVGNVFGGIITGFLLLPWLKTTDTIKLFVLIGLVFLLFVNTKRFYKYFFIRPNILKGFKISIFLLLIFLSLFYFPDNNEFYSTIHFPEDGAIIYIEEGVDNVVVTFEYYGKIINYINGLSHGIRPGFGYYNEAIEQISYARNAENILIIGFGTGSFVEAALKLENIDRVTLVELSESVIENSKKIDETNKILNDERLDIVIDDIRRHLQRTDKKFDVILMDPLRITTAYSNNLYSEDFFVLVNKHLKDGGIFGVWNNNEHTIFANTLLHAFENARIYSYFMIGSNDELVKNEDRYNQLLNSFKEDYDDEFYIKLIEKNKEIIFLADQTTLKEQLKNEKVNTDYHPWLEYSFGMKVRNLLKRIAPEGN